VSSWDMVRPLYVDHAGFGAAGFGTGFCPGSGFVAIGGLVGCPGCAFGFVILTMCLLLGLQIRSLAAGCWLTLHTRPPAADGAEETAVFPSPSRHESCPRVG
jgi:hypothetical protein